MNDAATKRNGDGEPQQEPLTDWQRLLATITGGCESEDEGFSMATGLHLGLAIALRHPEWAAGMVRSIAESGMRGQNSETWTNDIADVLVAKVPMERTT